MDIATGWQRHMLSDAGTRYYARTNDEGVTVVLGNRQLADTQRAADEAAGGVVAKVCGYGT
jgi:hypothetical protein